MAGYVIKLSSEEAIVFFDWLARYNASEQNSDPAEAAVLFDIEAQLESLLVEPLRDDYHEILESAKLKCAR